MTGTIPLWKIHVAEGFKEDCNELMNRCLQLKKLSYEKFCNIWKEMDFACVYYCNQSGAEIAEFSDEVIHTAKSFMFCSTSNFEETVAGVFLVYALLNIQPFVDFSPLKIVNEDVQHIERIERMARSQRRYDVLYILGSILIKGPCQYQVTQRERGLEYTIRKYLEEDDHEFCGGVKGVFNKDKEELDLLGEIKEIAMKYAKNKLTISGTNKVYRNLSYSNDGIPLYLETSLKKVIYGFNMPRVGEPESKEGSQSAKIGTNDTNIAAIKQKAMSSSVTSMRHLTGLHCRESKGADSPKKCSPQKSPHKSRSPTPSPRKRFRKSRKPSKTVSRIVFESTDESDDSVTRHEDNDAVPPSDSNEASDNSDKTNDNKVSADDNIKAVKHSDETVEVKTDSLPVLITAPNETEYFIEFIDYCNTTKENTAQTDAEKSKKLQNLKKVDENTAAAQTVDEKSKDIQNLKKVNTKTVNENEHSDAGIKTKKDVKRKKIANISSDDNDGRSKELPIHKKPKMRVKKEKRDLKNNKITSTFQRMGLLDMVKVTKKEK